MLVAKTAAILISLQYMLNRISISSMDLVWGNVWYQLLLFNTAADSQPQSDITGRETWCAQAIHGTFPGVIKTYAVLTHHIYHHQCRVSDILRVVYMGLPIISIWSLYVYDLHCVVTSSSVKPERVNNLEVKIKFWPVQSNDLMNQRGLSER